jgi:enoyl-CoA hydratase/carnithine racemase
VSRYQSIRYEVDGAILRLTLDRPDKLNAFNVTMADELVDAFRRADAEDAVRVVVVTGAGRAFCSGADLSGGPSSLDGTKIDPPLDPETFRESGGVVTREIFSLSKPVIAAINGAAVGIGVTMTLPMDIRLASSAARFSFVFARIGAVPEGLSSWFLPRVVNPSQAAEWLYTGRMFGAEEALRGGLVSRVLEPEALLPAAIEIAREIAENTAPVSVALCRQMMWRGLIADHPGEMQAIESKGIYWRGQSPDMAEGIAAILEKRPARFTQRVSRDMPPHYPWWNDDDTTT